MTKRKAISKVGLIVVIAVSLFICPLATGAYFGAQGVTAQAQVAQFTFVPQLTPINIEATPEATTPAALVPGQYFEEGDPSLPTMDEDSILGDSLYGFGRLAENLDLYLLWMTDAKGRHYLVVESTSEVISGGTDPDSGYLRLVRNRETLAAAMLSSHDDSQTQARAATNYRWGTVGFLAAAAICFVFTGGVCVTLIAAAAVPFWASMGSDTDAELERNEIESNRRLLQETEAGLRSRFRIGQAIESVP